VLGPRPTKQHFPGAANPRPPLREVLLPPYPCRKCGHVRDEHEDRVGACAVCSCEGFEYEPWPPMPPVGPIA
jgi:hypothetical protein